MLDENSNWFIASYKWTNAKNSKKKRVREIRCVYYTQMFLRAMAIISRVCESDIQFFFSSIFQHFSYEWERKTACRLYEEKLYKRGYTFQFIDSSSFYFCSRRSEWKKKTHFHLGSVLMMMKSKRIRSLRCFFSSFLLWAFSIIELYLKFFFFEAKLLMIIFVVWPDEMVRINDRRSQQHIKSWYFLYINKTMMIAWNSAVATVADVVADK